MLMTKLNFENESSAKNFFTKKLISPSLKQFACVNTQNDVVRRTEDMKNFSLSEISRFFNFPEIYERDSFVKKLFR